MFATINIQLAPRISARFGEVNDIHKTPHTGVDIALPIGSPVYVPEGGIVSKIVDYGNSSLGKAVFVKTKSGQYIFGHLSEIKVRMGERVFPGDVIALSGNTGNSTGPHLHVGLIDKVGAFADPEKVNPHLGIVGRVIQKAWNDAGEGIRDQARSKAYNFVLGVMEGLRDLVVDMSYTIALLGGGLCIIFHVAGWDKGMRWAGILTVAYVLIKYLLG